MTEKQQKNLQWSQMEYYYARTANYRNLEIFCVTVLPPDASMTPAEMMKSDDPHLLLCTLEEVSGLADRIIRPHLPENNPLAPESCK